MRNQPRSREGAKDAKNDKRKVLVFPSRLFFAPSRLRDCIELEFDMPTLATTVDGLRLPNPFIIASGPPGTNANVIGKALDEGWGGVIAKTISLDASKVINVAPRYARLRTEKSKEII